MRFRQTAGLFQFFLRRIWPTNHQVFANGAVEQHAFLEHHTYITAQAFQRHIAQIMPIERHTPFLGVPKSLQQGHGSRFAGTSRPNQGNGFAWRCREIHMAENRLPPRIGEGDIFERHFTLRAGNINRIRLFRYGSARIQHREKLG